MSIRKGNCPNCGAGPRQIDGWRNHNKDGTKSVFLQCTNCKHKFDPPPSIKKISTKLQSAIAVLKEHNAWRRGAETEQTDPHMLGVAIDLVVAEYEKKECKRI